MKFAVTLRFDEVTDQRLAALRAKVAESATLHDPYPAHITLAAFQTETPSSELWGCLEAMAEDWPELDIILSGIGIFAGPHPVAWAAPAITPAILDCQLLVQKTLEGVKMSDHFLPGNWVPHATLATTFRSLGGAIEDLARLWVPIRGYLNRLDLITFPPVHIVNTLHLHTRA